MLRLAESLTETTMSAAFSFPIPSSVPQDLQLIQDIVGELPPPPTNKLSEKVHSDNEHGTDSDTDSEEEVEAGILGDAENGDVPSESTSESDSGTDSDTDSEEAQVGKTRLVRPPPAEADVDDDEAAETSENNVRTKNEAVEVEIVVPEISEVGPDEQLEGVGEVMNIIDKLVIVKGTPSGIVNRGSEKALDSDTLLVFEDRKVLGYIFETFGPTSEPLYQVRFNQKYPLDAEKVRVGRPVFHVPAKSNYVFVQQLRLLKGSDASNVHDEEPGDDELEFSDDEQEAAYKRTQVKRREQSRSRSVVSTRHSTPVPSHLRDQDMADDPYGGSSFDKTRYNDAGLAGPSRPAPIPYDDPYSDAYGSAPPELKSEEGDSKPPPSPYEPSRGRGRGRGRGGSVRDYPPYREDSNRGGRGRGRRHHDRGRGRGRGYEHRVSSDPWSGREGPITSDYGQSAPRPMSPTSLAIARATGQCADGSSVPPNMGGGAGWGYPQHPMQPFDFSLQPQFPLVQPHIQPHINPRFAANFAMANMGMSYGGYPAQSAPYSNDTAGYAVGGYGSGHWNGDWDTSQPPYREDGGN
ncbi:Gar1/Naf1 RNA binding region-domain-containing protein [Fomes fomentarius]|nr:Gar1/Naf1 RNA binding region-domain-containing protein [Fomes fomentarius]